MNSFLRILLLALLLAPGACVPRATRPVRVLSGSALSSTPPAKRFASHTAQVGELRAKMERHLSAAALASLRYEPALEGVARTLGETWVTTEQPPARNVLWWLHWRAGVAGSPAGHYILSGDWNLKTSILDAALATWSASLDELSPQPRAWAVVRFETTGGEVAQVLVLADDSVELDLPRSAPAGHSLDVKGRLKVPAQKLTLFVEDDERTIREVLVPLDLDGRFSVVVPGPKTAGTRFLELVRLPPSQHGAQEWSRPVVLVPMLIDVPEPATPSLNVAEPKPNPPDQQSWPGVVRAAWDERRKALALAPLQHSPALGELAAKLARTAAEFPGAPPEPQLIERVNERGIIAREVVAHTADAEFLDELVWQQWLRPSIRHTLLATAPPVHGAGFAQEADGTFVFAEVLAHPVGQLDTAAEVAALHARFAELREGTLKPGLQRNPRLDEGLAALASKACASGGEPQKAELLHLLSAAKLTGPSTWLSHTSSRLLPVDLAGLIGELPRTEATHLAIAACQYQASVQQGRELVVILLVDARPGK